MNIFLRTVLFFISIVSLGCMANNKDSSFQLFWNEFRTAVVEDNYANLEKLTKFPLEVRGVHDSMPIEYFKNDEFKIIFDRIMEQKIYSVHEEDLVLTNMKAIVNDTELVSDMKNGDQYRVEQLVFDYIDGQWFFTNAYLEE